ncbi:OmpA family protein [Nannocystaceae bacterium ST9]
MQSALLPRGFVLALATSLAGGCASMPKVEPIGFTVDRDVLEPGVGEAELERALAALRADPELHLRLIGNADEDNTDEYNDELSRRRAEHLREQLIARDPGLADRIDTEARGELDASAPGSDEQAKARNRRVELRFFYPRVCEPSFDGEFLACELARLPPAPAPEPTPEPLLAQAEPPPAKPPPPSRKSFTGPWLMGMIGYGVTSAEYLRQHVRWGVGGGYSWGWDSEFRIAAGLSFDHLVDVGFLFPQPDSCAPFCDRVERSALRFVPEVRIGGANQVFWAWIRLNGGLVVQHRERLLDEVDGQTFAIAPETWIAGGVFGIGPGVAFALTKHLFLEFDATASYSVIRGLSGGGTGIYDVGVGLGWLF